MFTLYICEKADQAAKLANVLGIKKKSKGFFDGGDRKITWASGHMFEQYMPEDYNEALKKWDMDLLPIIPDFWKTKISKNRSGQVKLIKSLLQTASQVIISTDYDREGEAIARDLIRYSGYKNKPIQRLKLRALDPTSIRRALDDIVDGSVSLPLYQASQGRSRADWLLGLNFSRLYTLLGRQIGINETLHIGRVLTPLIQIVVLRDKAVETFQPHPYYELFADILVADGNFIAKWLPSPEYCDELGHCINNPIAQNVIQRCQGKTGAIGEAEYKKTTSAAPLTLSLIEMQKLASKLFSYSSDQVLKICQRLYDNEYLSYPRTDCGYLPESQHGDAAEILANLIQSDPKFGGLVNGADPSRKSRAFDDKKVTAHHAIIPTTIKPSFDKFSEEEKNIYDLARRYYLAQFYPLHEYNKAKITANIEGEEFIATGKTTLKEGWRVVLAATKGSDQEDDESVEQKEEPELTLPSVHNGEPCQVRSANLESKTTRPPPSFTESALLSAMENVTRFINEPELRKALKDQKAGLGTPATRADIIAKAVKNNLLNKTGRKITGTQKARTLLSLVAPSLASPTMTAAWEQQLTAIADGKAELTTFVDSISTWVSQITNHIKSNADKLSEHMSNSSEIQNHIRISAEDKAKSESECFSCGGVIVRRKRQKAGGHYWKCTEGTCQKFFNDNRGKPEPPIEAPAGPAPNCPDCGASMTIKKSNRKVKGKPSLFWGCSKFKDGCRGLVPVTD